jgi:hypothetical protein
MQISDADVYELKVFKFQGQEELLSFKSNLESPPSTALTDCQLLHMSSGKFIDV